MRRHQQPAVFFCPFKWVCWSVGEEACVDNCARKELSILRGGTCLREIGLFAGILQAALTKARIEALTDGIFATVMTVLVLGLRVPAQNLSESALGS